MKSINDYNNNGCNNNWLGFTLSPQMKMEVSSEPQQHQQQHQQQDNQYQHHHHQVQPTSSTVPNTAPSTFYLSPPLFKASGIIYGVRPNDSLPSSLSVMPLKSDGSLCLIDSLPPTRPKGMVPSPKLEDFLRGASMATHEYGNHGRESMVLSLDSVYYNQSAEQEADIRQHQQLPVQSHHPFYSGIPCNGIYQALINEEVKKTHISNYDSQIPLMAENLGGRQYFGHSDMEEPINGDILGDAGSVGGQMSCGDLQSLSLSMSPGSQSSCFTASTHISPAREECAAMETKKRGAGKVGQKQPVHRKSIDTFGQRTSQYRGVTRCHPFFHLLQVFFFFFF